MPFCKSLPENAGPPVIYTSYPDVYGPWSELSEVLMNGPSTFSEAEREAIFALAAGGSGSFNVYVAHAEVAYARGYPVGLLDQLLAGDGFERLDEKMRPVAAYAIKLGRAPNDLTQADADAVFAAGWDEAALHDIVAISARAAFMHRLTAGFGFTPLTREQAAVKAKARIEKGYVNLYPSLAARKG